MAKDEKDKKVEKKPAKTPEQIEAEKAAKAAKKAEMAAKAKEQGGPAGAGAPPRPPKAAVAAEKKARAAAKANAKTRPERRSPSRRDTSPASAKRYEEQIAPALTGELGLKNRMALPRLSKIVISMGLGKAIAEKPRLEAALKELSQIAGQKAVICKAKKSVSNFKLREGMEIGAKVTLRGIRMWEFLDRLIMLAIPRVKDFRGLNPKGFDGRGNYSLGLAEQTVFPEIRADAVTFHQGMNISIVTTAPNDAQAHSLLKHLGMPFQTVAETDKARKAG